MTLPLMPKATAVWLIENTSLTFFQISQFCGLHELEVQGIADGDVATGMQGYDPVDNNQLTKEEIVLAPTVTNYAKEGSVLYDFTFYDPTGIKFIDLGGGQMRKITGHEHKAQELKSPVTVVIEGSKGVTVTDKTVVSDVECFVLIQETTTGATTTAKLKTIKA